MTGMVSTLLAQLAPEIALQCRLEALEALRGEAQASLLDSQSHFTCSALLPGATPTSCLVVLGTTLGQCCIVSQSRLLSRGKQQLRDVMVCRWQAHSGAVTGLCCTGAMFSIFFPRRHELRLHARCASYIAVRAMPIAVPCTPNGVRGIPSQQLCLQGHCL
jgi:hypothetical protein